jgi:hypothetical protein
MITESHFWKVPLLRSASWLERLRVVEATSERSLVRIERELFNGFYGVRKLLETFAVSSSTKKKEFSLAYFPCVKRVDYFNAHRIEELFDFESKSSETRDIGFLCNQFIHSYVFQVVLREDGAFDGALISSDRLRQEKLFLVESVQILDTFRLVGRDYPAEMHLSRNPKSLQWQEVDK